MQVKLLPFQMEMLQRDDEELLIASCGVSSGKTFGASVYIAKALCEQKRVIAGAQNYTALNRVLFGEIRKRLNEWKVPYEYRKTEKEIQVGEGICFGATSENPDAILGLSDIDILTLDEASYLNENLYLWGCDRLRGPKVDMPRVRLFTSPDSFNATHAWFVNLCAKYPRSVIHASALDNDNTSEAFKRSLLERYPKGTQLYDQQILGLCVDARSANMAIDDRLFMFSRPEHCPSHPVWVGCDLAGAGRDDSVFIVIDDYGFVESRRYHHAETQELVSELLELNRTYDIAGGCIDCTGGFGNGLFDYTKRSIRNLEAVNFGSASSQEHFNNLRTEMHFGLAESASGLSFYVPMTDDGDKIREECRYALYYINPQGKTAMFPKEDIKKSIGRSPDALDALLLANRARMMSEGGIRKSTVDARTVAQRMAAAMSR